MPAPEERNFETQVFTATAFEVLLKSMRGLCAGRFLCGKSFSGLPEDNVTSASVSTLAAILTDHENQHQPTGHMKVVMLDLQTPPRFQRMKKYTQHSKRCSAPNYCSKETLQKLNHVC